jgi:2-amino-4-hydroxy-6-hydroxymethyldihydropteridine diphosphokinase
VTPPLGPPQPDYLNAALRLETALHPRELLPRLLAIEALLGRERRVRWGPRTIDLDVLYWSGGPVRELDLSVPHPGLAERPFAIAPLLDVAPELADRYRAEPPPRRPWARMPEQALDPLDALAFATSARLGDPGAVTRVERFEGTLPDRGPAFVVLERWEEAARRGSKLL